MLLVGLFMLGVMGCSPSKPEETTNIDDITIVPKRSGNAVELNARAVFSIMKRCGFTDEQVYYHGTALREALRSYGGACIYVGKGNAEVLLRVQGEEVQGVSQSYGYFVYDVKAGEFKLGGVTQPQVQDQRRSMAPR
jgi:hypothetical protein